VGGRLSLAGASLKSIVAEWNTIGREIGPAFAGLNLVIGVLGVQFALNSVVNEGKRIIAVPAANSTIPVLTAR
jgi:nickel-dependent lactate racemase